MLIARTTAAAGKIAPGVIVHHPVLPVRQAVISNRQGGQVIIRQQVTGSVVAKMRGAVTPTGFIVFQQAAFGVVTVVYFTAQGVADAHQLAASGVTIKTRQNRLFRQRDVCVQPAALQAASAQTVILAVLRAHPLAAFGFSVQAVAGEFANGLLIKADGADVGGAVMQPCQLLPAGQGEGGQVARSVICIMQLTVYSPFTEQLSRSVIRKLNLILIDTPNPTFGCWHAPHAGKLSAVVTPVMVSGIAGRSCGEQAAVVIAELLPPETSTAVGGRAAALLKRSEKTPLVPLHLP